MQQLFMFKTEFSNGRPNFSELICADNAADADRLAVAICQGISDEYPCDLDVEVEILGPRAVDLEYITEMIAEAEAAEEAKDNKLWVFDSQQYLEVYAPTKEAALKEASKTETYTGMEFVLVHDWELYQEEAELKGAI